MHLQKQVDVVKTISKKCHWDKWHNIIDLLFMMFCILLSMHVSIEGIVWGKILNVVEIFFFFLETLSLL